MLGQADQAVLAYYELWRAFPGTMFGMAASAKLELAPRFSKDAFFYN
jgi:hypothetical protein